MRKTDYRYDDITVLPTGKAANGRSRVPHPSFLPWHRMDQ